MKNSILQKMMNNIIWSFIFVAVVFALALSLFVIPYMTEDVKEVRRVQLETIKDNYCNYVEAMDLYLSSFRNDVYLEETLSHKGLADEAMWKARTEIYLRDYQMNYPNALYTVIQDSATGDVCCTLGTQTEEVIALLQANEFYADMKKLFSRYISPVCKGRIWKHSFFYCAKQVWIGNRYYLITVFWNADNLLELIDTIISDNFDYYMIVNGQEETICTNLEAKQSERVKGQLRKTDLEKFTGLQGICTYESVIDYGGFVLGFTSSARAYRAIYIGVASVAVVLLSMLACVLLVTKTMNQKHLKNISFLTKQMKEASVYGPVPAVIESGDEIEEMSTAFYKLIKTLQRQAKEMKRQEKKIAIAEYQVLSTQLDPHFVSNTMSIINFCAQKGQNEDIIKINNALLEILRDGLKNKHSVMASVENEVQVLKDYLSIMNYRYQSHIQMHYEVSESVWKKMILKNILQMLVENSIIHGFLKNEQFGSGEIHVMIYELSNEIVIEVSDNGCGIEQESVDYLRRNQFRQRNEKSGHIGLSNIYERLFKICGNHFSFDIDSIPGKGTTVIVSMPNDMKREYAVHEE